jgi:hypothetical protein
MKWLEICTKMIKTLSDVAYLEIMILDREASNMLINVNKKMNLSKENLCVVQINL